MNRALRTKLFVLMVSVAVIPAFSASVISQTYFRDILHGVEMDRIQRTVNQSATNLDMKLQTIISDMFYFIAYSDQGEQLLHADAVPGGLTEDMRIAGQKMGAFRLRYTGEIESLFFYRGDGVFFYDYGLSADHEVDFKNMQWFKRFQDQSSDIWGRPSEEVFFYQDHPVKTVYIMMGMYNLTQRDGILVVRLSPELFATGFRHLTGPNIAIAIKNAIGDVVYSSDPLINESKQINATMMKNNHWIMLQTQMQESGFTIETYVNNSIIIERVDRITQINIFIIGVSICVAFLFAFLFSTTVTRPVRALLRLMRKVEKGDFAVSFPVKHEDEIGNLGLVFNRMIGQVSDLISKVYETRMEKMAAQIRQKEAVIQAMQSQINPHFLYNTLETINCRAILHNAPDISIMCRSLADFFRYSIEKRQLIVPLQKEIEHVRTYLQIQEERFPKLNVDIDIPHELLPCPIIKLTLQPLLENAFTHGFQGDGDYGIRVWGEEANDDYVIYIEDNGEGMETAEMAKLNQLFTIEVEDVMDKTNIVDPIEIKGSDEHINDFMPMGRNGSTGIGLMNVHQRIRLLFGNDYGLWIFETPGGGVTIQITLPWKKGREL